MASLAKQKKPVSFKKNRAELVKGGAEYFTLLHEMIASASDSIHFQTYIFDPDETGTSVVDALVAAARRNVKVYLMVDEFGSQGLTKPFIANMVSAGIQFKWFRPLFKSKRYYVGRRLHHKVVVVDGWRATVAGLNISNRYNDMPDAEAWLDWAMYVEGDVADGLSEVCRKKFRIRKNVNSLVKPHGIQEDCQVSIRVNDWIGGKREIYNSYLQMLRGASSEVTFMSAYFLPGRAFRKAMARAAARGVKIRVVLTGNADVFLIKYAERFIYRWLFKNGVEVYEYTPNVLHAKIAFCDGRWMTTGSFNINNLSAFGSIELNLDVTDETFVRRAGKRIEEIIRTKCVRITERKFEKQFNFLSRFAHRFAYLIFRLLFFLSTKQRMDY